MTKLDNYESALLTELRTYVEQRPASPPAPVRRRRRYVYAGLVAAAAAGIASVALPGAGPSPAYAVTERDGRVHVTVRVLDDADGLEQALAAHGVHADITYLPAGKRCAKDRFEYSPRMRFFGVSKGAPLPDYDSAVPLKDGAWIGIVNGGGDLELDLPADITRPGETFVLSVTEPDRALGNLAGMPEEVARKSFFEDAFRLDLGLAQGAVSSCSAIDIPAFPSGPTYVCTHGEDGDKCREE